MSVLVIGKNGEELIPTERYGKVRHLLKDGKAVIHSHHPFTIQLTYEIENSYRQASEQDSFKGEEEISMP